MKALILVLTPDQTFGEWIREALEDSGAYQVWVVSHPEGFKKALEARDPHLTIVDGTAAEGSVARWVAWVRAQAPQARVILIPPEGFSAAQMAALKVDALLDKPFYLPDLLALVASLTEGEGSAAAPPEGAAPGPPPSQEWPATRLAPLLAETAAMAAMVVGRSGEPLAMAGRLSPPMAAQLAEMVREGWAGEGRADFARYLPLEGVAEEGVLYVTPLTSEAALAVLFEARVPFTRIRAEAARMARALTQQPAPEAAPAAPTAPPPSEEGAPSPPTPPSAPPPPLTPALEEEEEPLPPEALEPLFEDVPPPTPLAEEGPSDGASVPSEGRRPAEPQEALPFSAREAPAAESEGAEASPKPPRAPEPEGRPSPPPGEAAAAEEGPTRPALTEMPTMAVPLSPLAPPPQDAEEQPLPPPATLARADLSYACVLVPRMPQQHITGDLARELNRWVQRIATAFGWRLLHLAVRPKYLYWVVQVWPNTSAAYAVQVMREHTSSQILAHFPHLAEENPSGDFWAPGYLVVARAQSLSQQTILKFLREVRIRQGLEEE